MITFFFCFFLLLFFSLLVGSGAREKKGGSTGKSTKRPRTSKDIPPTTKTVTSPPFNSPEKRSVGVASHLRLGEKHNRLTRQRLAQEKASASVMNLTPLSEREAHDIVSFLQKKDQDSVSEAGSTSQTPEPCLFMSIFKLFF